MKKTILVIAATIGIIFYDFSQDGPVTINTKQNLFAVNESGAVLLRAITSVKSDESISIFVDTLTPTTFDFRSHIFPKELVIDTFPDGHIDTTVLIGSRNIQATRVFVDYYGDNELRIQIQDSRIVAVQQAMDSSGNWVSVEHFIHSDCGNSYSSARIRKNQSYQFKIAKYEGNYQTKMRLKALINGQILYSNEFTGNINYEQLNSIYNKKKKDEYLFN
jgi:hypothetical protein